MVCHRLLDIARVYLVSPEFAVLVLSCAVLVFYPKPVTFFGSEIIRQGSVLQYIALLPIGLLITSYRLSKDILGPLEGEKNRVLYEWPNYWRLKVRALAALFFCLGAAITGVILWVFKTHIPPGLLGTGFVAAIMIALISTITLFLGYLRLREILRGGP